MLERPDSEGRGLPGVKVDTLDPETLAPLPPGVTGRIRILSPAVVGQIIETGRRSRERHGQGWGIPGDIGSIDATGFVTIVGRETT